MASFRQQVSQFDAYFLSHCGPAPSGPTRQIAAEPQTSSHPSDRERPVLSSQAPSEATPVLPGLKCGRKRGIAGTQGLQACLRCRSLKRRCDGHRPCGTCIKRGCASECVDWHQGRALSRKLDSHDQDSSCSLISRPIRWRKFGVCVGGRGPAPTQDLTSWPDVANRQIVQGFFSFPFFGTHTTRCDDIIACLPEVLIEAIAECAKFSSQRQDFFRQIMCAPTSLSSVDQMNLYPGVAYIVHSIQPDGSDAVQINEAYSTMFHAHPEEVLARLGRRELPSVFSDLDALCLVLNCLDWTLCSFNDRVEVMQFHCIVGRGTDYTAAHDPALVRVEVRVRYDDRGHPAVIENWYSPLTEAEFDLALELSPHFCRPFAAVSGDRRRGAELRRDYGRERAVSLAVHAQGEGGMRERLCDLGALILRRLRVAQRRFKATAELPAYPFIGNPLLPEPCTEHSIPVRPAVQPADGSSKAGDAEERGAIGEEPLAGGRGAEFAQSQGDGERASLSDGCVLSSDREADEEGGGDEFGSELLSELWIAEEAGILGAFGSGSELESGSGRPGHGELGLPVSVPSDQISLSPVWLESI